jgi:hypothetical protein
MIWPSIKTFFSFHGLNDKALKMKILKTLFLPLFLLVFSFNGLAQESSQINNPKLERLESLSQEQKALLKERRKIIKCLRADFKASLNETQSAILKNDSMDKYLRRKAFVKSLTEEQRALYRAMREEVHQSRGAYHKSLSEDQKRKIVQRHKHKRKHHHKGVEEPFSPPPPAPPEAPEPIKNIKEDLD